MTLNDDQKVSVVLAALQERYQALRTIRDRVQSIGLWALGLLGGAGAWMIQADRVFLPNERLVGLVGLLSAVAVLRWAYLSDLEKGFLAQQQVAVTLERALGLYDPHAFVSDSSLYPQSWASAGTGTGQGEFFKSTYRLIFVAALFLTIVIVGV